MPLSTGEPQGLTAAVTWFGGVIGLGTFFLNRQQKDYLARREHQLAQQHESRKLAQAQEHETTRIEDSRQHELLRDRREYDLSELQRLNEQYLEHSRNLTASEEGKRIQATIALGELATYPKVSKNSRADVLTNNAQIFVDAENYPYFEQSARRLAAALHQSSSPGESKQLLITIEQLASFACTPGTSEMLLHSLVNILAESNRVALEYFWRPLMAVWGRYEDPLMIGRIPFVSDTSRHFDLEDIAGWVRNFRHTDETFDSWAGDLKNFVDDRLEIFTLRIRRLHNTQQALSVALRKLSLPPEISKAEGVFDDAFWETLRNRRSLDISKTFLCCADLTSSNLQGVNFSESFLHCAVFYKSDCRGSLFNKSLLISADFNRPTPVDPQTNTSFSQFKNSVMNLTNFSHCMCTDCEFFPIEGFGVFRNTVLDRSSLPSRNGINPEFWEGASLTDCIYPD